MVTGVAVVLRNDARNDGSLQEDRNLLVGGTTIVYPRI